MTRMWPTSQRIRMEISGGADNVHFHEFYLNSNRHCSVEWKRGQLASSIIYVDPQCYGDP